MLARYWVRQGVNFDEVYSGALVRQRRAGNRRRVFRPIGFGLASAPNHAGIE